MLNFFRRKDATARYMLGGILVIICFAMVMFLIPGFGGGNTGQPGGVDTLASVGSRAITVNNFQSRFNQLQQTGRLPAQLIPLYGQQIVQNLIMQDALALAAQRMGFSASRQEVAAAIRREIPQLFPNGAFVGETAYEDYIQNSQQMTVAEFERKVRDQVMVQKLYDLVTDGARVSEAEVHQAYVRQFAKAVFDYVILDPEALAARVPVTPAALASYYKANESKYLAPERRTMQLLIADLSQFAARVKVTPADARQYYQANIASYTFPERVRLAHILYKTAGDSPAQTAQAKQQAQATLDQLHHGAHFADLAKKSSQDDASASQGGELGWISRGRMYPSVEQVAFSLPAGQTSGVITTPYGFEIVKVEAHQPAHVESFDQVAPQITQQLQQQQAVAQAQHAMDQARLEATSTPLPEVARQYGLQFVTTPPLSRTDPVTGIGINEEFENDVFTAALQAITPVVKVPAGFAMAKVAAIQPPAIQPLSAVQDQVERDYRRQQATTLAAQYADELHKKAASVGLKAAAASLQLKVAASPALGADGTLPDAGPISSFAPRLFALKPGQVGPVAKIADRNIELVYQLVSLQQPPPGDFAKQAPTIRDSLLAAKQQMAFTAYADQLRDRLTKDGTIKVNDTLLKSTLGSLSQGS